ncbi:MAG: ATP-binding protein [Actinomycetota bacterium]
MLSAHPVEAEAQLGFAALADVMEPVLDEVAPALAEPQRHALAVALLRERPGPGRLDQRAVSAATLSVLRLLASEGPLILAIDDLQWLDRPSARVLEFALRRLGRLPVGMLACERLGEAAPSSQSTQRLQSQRRSSRLVGGEAEGRRAGEAEDADQHLELDLVFPERPAAHLGPVHLGLQTRVGLESHDRLLGLLLRSGFTRRLNDA